MRDSYKKYFEERFLKYGQDVRTFWGNEKAQLDRFAVLCKIGNLEGKSILDIGCGFGDLLGYLRANRIRPSSYLGIDCVEQIISVAQTRYPDARFFSSDVSDLPEHELFDYVFASGIFFLSDPAWVEYTLKTLRTMYFRARIAVAANFLSCFGGKQDAGSQYLNPGDFLSLVMNEVTPTTELRHSYRANDFTIFFYKDWQDGGRG
jgi:SAM-dependent methyltransferase